MRESLITLLAILFAVSTSFAQLEMTPAAEDDDDAYRSLKNSFGFGIVGGGELRNNIWPMPGLGYKHYMKDGAFRVMVGGIVNNNINSGGGWSSANNEAGANIRVGYQYHVLIGRFMPIIGVDIAGGYYERENSWSGFEEITRNSLVGISPNLGLEFWVTKKLSVLLDTRFDISYQDHYYKSESSWDPWNPNQVNITESQGIQTHISPISSFMAIFHF